MAKVSPLIIHVDYQAVIHPELTAEALPPHLDKITKYGIMKK